tara:strand:- start:9801 stop:10037 length:237 start_codon:yes stop_codon:yes gene_type:complete
MKDKNWKPSGPSGLDEQTDAFRFALDDLVGRYLSEFDLNTFIMIGALQEKVIELATAGNFECDLDLDDLDELDDKDEE